MSKYYPRFANSKLDPYRPAGGTSWYFPVLVVLGLNRLGNEGELGKKREVGERDGGRGWWWLPERGLPRPPGLHGSLGEGLE